MSCICNYINYYNDKNPQCSSAACVFVNCLHREITYLNQYTCISSDSRHKIKVTSQVPIKWMLTHAHMELRRLVAAAGEYKKFHQ